MCPIRPRDLRVPRARALRREMTEAERKLWQRLRAIPFDVFHFRRQATIGPYFADFASHSSRLVVEVDGGQHVDNVGDAKRMAYLKQAGYRVIRFWNNDVLQNIDGVAAIIYEAIKSWDPPPLTPPHRKAGGGEECGNGEQ